MNLGPRHWGLALLVAALLHATAGVSLMLPAQDEGAETSDETGIEVMLGEAGAANQEAPRPETEPTPEPEPKPQPTPQPKPEPVPPPEPPKPVPQPRPVPTPPPQPAPAVDPQPDEPAPTDTVSTAAEAAPATAAAAPPPPAAQAGGGVAGAAATARKKSYFGQLAAHLARHQRYPMEARRRKITGVVMVHFRFNQQGQIQEFNVTESSGNRLLDNEAIAMLKRAQPLPAIPAELGADMLSISLPIEFSLRRR